MNGIGTEEPVAGPPVVDESRRVAGFNGFWGTQPVIHIQGSQEAPDGPIRLYDLEQIPKEASPLLEGFEWATLDMADERGVEELWQLLSEHYMEDGNSTFRFGYSQEFLRWALMTPGWRSGWHIGVRATQSRKLVASICGVPNKINVRGQSLLVAAINFLCIHKKLRSKRLAPLLIKEVTRRCCLDGVYQAIYTAKDVLSTPIGTCQSYHRPLNWVKLYEAGFISHSYIPSKTREAAKYRLSDKTSTPRLRAMQTGDIDAVWCLLGKYLRRFHLYPVFSREDIGHWLHATGSNTDQIIWPYVVETPGTKKITEFVSFYGVDAKILLSFKHSNVRMASLYYYASETAFTGEENGLQERLQMLINDALILAKNAGFDVFNALALYDNSHFLERLRFRPGNGQLHYYMYNYRTSPIPGVAHHKDTGGIGLLML